MSFCLPLIEVSIVSVVLSIAPIFGNSLLGGVRLREASTLRFEGRLPTNLKINIFLP